MKRRLFHLYRKDCDQNKYYGSLTATFKAHKDLGVSKYTLDRWDFTVPFENDIFILRKDFLETTGDIKNKKIK